MSTKQKTLAQNKIVSSLRYTLDGNQNNMKMYRFHMPKSPQRQQNANSQPSAQMLKNNTYSTPNIISLTQSHNLKSDQKNVSNQQQNRQSKSPWKINELLKKNKSNEHLPGLPFETKQTKGRLLSPPLLGHSLRNTLEANTQYFKNPNKNEKQALLQNHKKLFKKDKNSNEKQVKAKSPQFFQKIHQGQKSLYESPKNDKEDSKLSKYKIIRQIENDYFSNRYLCVQISTCTIWAIRRINKKYTKSNNLLVQDLLLSFKFQMWITNTNVVQIYDIFDDKDYVYVIEQFMQSGSLKKYCQNRMLKLSESQIGQKTNQIISGLESVHQNNLYHGKINSQDIMVTHETCKIGALKKNVIEDQIYLCSRFQYMPPQVYIDRGYDSKSDMWGIGLILYEMCMGKKLLEKENSDNTFKVLLQFDINEHEFGGQYPQTFSKLIKELLEFDREKRLDIKKLKQQNILQNYAFQKQWAQTSALLLEYQNFQLTKSQKAKKEETVSPSFLKKKFQPPCTFIQRVESKKQGEFRTVSSTKKQQKNQTSFKFIKRQQDDSKNKSPTKGEKKQ